jgi:hypothetical protein
MGFGAIIAAGERNQLLPDRVLDYITEVRVEQSLDEPTRFAIRFQEDIIDGEPAIGGMPELQPEQMLAIAVQSGDAIRCLLRGPITDVQCSVMRGGPGSWYQVNGQDRRVEMNRQYVRRAWSGRASAAAQTILGQTFDDTQVEQTNLIYGAPRSGTSQVSQTLNQRTTNAAFIRQIARQNNLQFWIEYECRLNGLDPTSQSLEITETANLKPSPPRPNGAAVGALPIDLIQLVPTVAVALRVNVKPDRYQNVTAFDLTENPERPNQFTGTAINERDLQESRTSATDPQPAIRQDGRGLNGSGVQRDVCITTAGNPTELQNRAESALTEAGWFVNATASTTAYMLCGVLMPHDVVEVEGLGSKHSGPYQVSAVTHVINAADHFMDIQLRRNATGGD